MTRKKSKGKKPKKQVRRRPRQTTNTVRKNAPVATTSVIRNRGVAKTIRIRHKEYINDLDIPAGAGVFSSLEINPGLSDTFSWLSAIAQRFETYRFNSLAFHYVPSVPTTTAGSLLLVPDYDPADDNSAISKQELFGFEDAVRGAWWTQFTCRCSPQNLHKQKEFFVRGSSLASNLYINSFDTLQLCIMRSGSVAVEGGGELWVEYDITLMTPQRKHEGEALQGKRSENVFQWTDTGAITAISNVYSIFRSPGPFIYDGDYLVRSPGVYQLDMQSLTSLEGTFKNGKAPINFPVTWQGTTREGTVDLFYESVADYNNFASSYVVEVLEQSEFPNSYGFLDLGTGIETEAGLVHNVFMTLTELLVASPLRIAFNQWKVKRQGKLATYYKKYLATLQRPKLPPALPYRLKVQRPRRIETMESETMKESDEPTGVNDEMEVATLKSGTCHTSSCNCWRQ